MKKNWPKRSYVFVDKNPEIIPVVKVSCIKDCRSK